MARTGRASAHGRTRVARLLIVAVAGIMLGVGAFSLWGVITDGAPDHAHLRPTGAGRPTDPRLLLGRRLRPARGHRRAHQLAALRRRRHHRDHTRRHDRGRVRADCAIHHLPISRPHLRRIGHQLPRRRARPHPVGPSQRDRPRGRRATGPSAPTRRRSACDDIAIDDPIELNGRNVYRTGRSPRRASTSTPSSRTARTSRACSRHGSRSGRATPAAWCSSAGFPRASRRAASAGTSASRPLAEGLAELGLDLCTTPDCGLTPPATPPG